jgi:predicted hotdog family 3-hydroxylacyl-ACP dehydratase
MFLVALAFNHARLLDEIDQLLTLLHNYIDEAEGEGRFSCSISSTPIPPSSSSNG